MYLEGLFAPFFCSCHTNSWKFVTLKKECKKGLSLWSVNCWMKEIIDNRIKLTEKITIFFTADLYFLVINYQSFD